MFVKGVSDTQGFISHRPGGVNSVVLKVFVVLPPVIIQSHRTLTRAPLGYSAERAPLGGGQILPPPA